MRDFIADHKLLIIAIIGVVLFLGFAISQRSDQTTTSSPYKEVDSASPMAKGKASAKVSVIQYSDFLCPSCSYFSTQVMPTIEKEFIDTGKVKFEFRPMAFIADGSTQAGMGAYCAIDQDNFWTYHDAIYTVVADKVFNKGLDPKSDIILTATDVKNIAASSGLDTQKFDSCLGGNTHQADIVKSTNTANGFGINSTPYILVDGQHYQGDISLDTFKAFIQAKL